MTPIWIAIGSAGLVLAGLVQSLRWTNERERIRQETARRNRPPKQAAPMQPVTGQHRAIRIVDTRPPSLASPAHPTRDDEIETLRRRIQELEDEVRIRPEPDPIIRAVAQRPMSATAIGAMFGMDHHETDRAIARLIHITGELERHRGPNGVVYQPKTRAQQRRNTR